MSMSQALSNIVHGNISFCCLCLQETKKNAVWIDDEIFIDSQDTQTMSELIKFIFGEHINITASTFGLFCDKCKVSMVDSYKFNKMCKENLQNLNSAVNNLSESFENMLPELESFNTLFVSIDLHDFTSKQFYDDINLVSTSKAYKRFISIVNPMVKPETERQEQFLHLKNLSEYGFNNIQKGMLKTIPKTVSRRKYKKNMKESMLYDISSVLTSQIAAENSSKYTCRCCSQRFTKENKLRWHFFKKHYPRNVKCSKCLRSFITDEMLKKHEDDCHSAGVCSECGKHYTSRYLLKKHELNHNVQITCDECGRVYRSPEAFKKHIIDDVCRQKSKKSADQATFECDFCSKRYCYKPYLAKHIMYEHGDAVGFRCKFCNKQFYTQSRLKTHLLKHTREKNFVCMICSGRFVTRESLIYHTRLHTGEKPYQCEHCDKAFLSASRRLDHVRRHHLPPSLECNICHAKFKATGSLLKHRKRHFNPNSKLNSIGMNGLVSATPRQLNSM